MTGAGKGISLGTGTLRGAGSLGGSPFAFTCQFFGWINGVPVVTTLSGDFGSWNNGAAFVDTGLRAPAPGPTGYCNGTATIQGIKNGVGAGRGYCLGTGTLKANGILSGSGRGYCTGTGQGVSLFPVVGSGSGYCLGLGTLTGGGPTPGFKKWYLRRISPVEPMTPVYTRNNSPCWEGGVTAKPPRQRQVFF